MCNRVSACTKNSKEVMLSGFTFMKDREPEEFEVCVIVERTGHLSAGCWLKGESAGVFRQGRGGIIGSEHVVAWFPIEEANIDVNNYDWNPMFRLIAEFYGVKVFASDKDSVITLDYIGGKDEMVIHMDVTNGQIIENDSDFEDIKYIKTTLMDWYGTYRDELVECYRNGRYYRLPDYEK